MSTSAWFSLVDDMSTKLHVDDSPIMTGYSVFKLSGCTADTLRPITSGKISVKIAIVTPQIIPQP